LDRTTEPQMDAIHRVIPALDTDHLEEARRWVQRFLPRIRIFKVGSQLFTRAGPRAVEAIKEAGGEVFLDLKYHDIPNTVGRAVAGATRLGVKFLNVHALGGAEMIRAAVQSSREEAARMGLPPPGVLAVTILTSLDAPQLNRMGLIGEVEDWVLRLAQIAVEAGADGLVASPREICAIRRVLGGSILLVTPGIRSGNAPKDDQRRVMGPREALEAGADYLVMGRSLLEAPDPGALLRELESP
jgi:orotidine-5'-phosphate decarboxylase